jgi:hypothetical protein
MNDTTVEPWPARAPGVLKVAGAADPPPGMYSIWQIYIGGGV